MIKDIRIEVMCGSIEDVLLVSQATGVDQIELNQAMELIGLTPTINTLKKAKEITSLPILPIVRARAGGFAYNQYDIEIMLTDAKHLIDNGADGIVFGFLKPNGELDVKNIKRMVEIIGHREVAFHKAFDFSVDLEKSIVQLIELGVNRVLTEGGNHQGDILAGIDKLTYLQEKYGDKITIALAGGVTADNAAALLNTTKCRFIHFSAKEYIQDPTTDVKHLRVSPSALPNILSAIENR